MANSMYIAAPRAEFSLAEVQAMVAAVFVDLQLPPPSIRVEPYPNKAMRGEYFFLEGAGPDDFCWADVDERAMPEVSEDPSRPFLISVTTRGDWRFGGAVALAFCRLGGGCVFNDSGQLDGSPTFDESTLYRALLNCRFQA